MIEQVMSDQQLIAFIVRSTFQKDVISFFTPNDFSQQLAYMSHPKGNIIKPHVHNPVSQNVLYTKKVLFIGKEQLRVDFYKASHFYDRQKSVVNGLGIAPTDVLYDFYKLGAELRAHLALLDEFMLLRKFAEANKLSIYNATKGGVIEAFERVHFDSLF